MLVKVGTAAVLCAAFMVAAAMPASAQNGGATRANGSYVPSRSGRPPRQNVQSQQDQGASAFQPPPNSLGQPMTDTMSKPFNRTVGSPLGR